MRNALLPAAFRRSDAAGVGAVALVSFLVQSVAWPLFPGRDAQTYLVYYLDLFEDPVFPQLMLLRTPVAPLFYGSLLDVGGGPLAEAGAAALFVSAVVAMYCAGCFWGRGHGVAVAAALCVYPAYGALFHAVSSDAPFAWATALWAVLVCATAARPTVRMFALNGLAVFLLVMIRPGALFLVGVLALLALVVPGALRLRARNALAVVVASAVPLVAFASYNAARFDDFTVSRLSSAQVPLYRLIAIDRLIDADNGPASRELAAAIERELLAEEPYRSYGVDLEEFLNDGRIRMWSDLAPLADRVWGWDDDYGQLRRASLEAIREHPGAYAKGVLRTMRDLLVSSNFEPRSARFPPAERTILCELRCYGDGTVEVDGRTLPELPEHGDLVPTGRSYWLSSTPDNSISTDWSNLERPTFRFDDPATAARFEELSAELDELMSELPWRSGSSRAADFLNSYGRIVYPPMWMWLVVGIAGLVVRRPSGSRAGVWLAVIGLGTVAFTAIGSPPAPEYRLPVDPLFVLVGVVGAGALVGDRLRPAAQRLGARRRARPGTT